MTSRASRWASRAGLPLLVAAMDAAWIMPYALLLGAVWGHPGAALLSPLSVFGLLAAAQAVTRTLLAGPAPVGRARVLLASAGATAAAAAVAAQYGGDPWWRMHGPLWHAADIAIARGRPEIPAFVLAALAWRRGTGTGRTAFEYYDIEATFYLGLAAFGVFAAGAALGHSEPAIAATAADALPYLVAFFATGLVALPVARLRSVRQRTLASPQAVTVGGDWYALIAGAVVAAILGVAVLAAALLRLDLAGALRTFGRLVDPLLWGIVYVVAVPLGVIVTGIVWAVRHLLHPGAAPPPQPGAPPAWLGAGPPQGAAGLPPAAEAALRWGIASLVVMLIVLWLARAMFRYGKAGTSPPAEEVHESVWSWADLTAGLAAWLRRRSHPAGIPSPGPEFGAGTAAAVRRAYAELLGCAAALGHPRAPHQTPAEFAGTLRAAWPGAAESVSRLTAVYSRVRYGLDPPSEADLAAVSDALAQVHKAVSGGRDGAIRANGHRRGRPDIGGLRRTRHRPATPEDEGGGRSHA